MNASEGENTALYAQDNIEAKLHRKYLVDKLSVTYRQRLDDHPNRLAKSLFQRTHYSRRPKRYYPVDLATGF